jgi:hypothetical protein
VSTPDTPTTPPPFPAGAFRQVGWAFLFLGISIGPTYRMGQETFVIDLLPDFVGYLMIATAANRLVPLHRGARAVRNLALLLTYLSIPTIVQYSVVTSQSANLTTWKAPLWPLTIVVGLLEVVLVWLLCGLVADLARRVGDATIERQARTRRVLYVVLRLLLTVGVGVALLVPNRELVITGAVFGVGVGLALLVMMMGLMRRAERLGDAWSEVPWSPAGAEASGRRGGRAFLALAVGGAILPVALAVGAVYYYLEWQQARDEEMRKASNSSYFSPARDEFYDHLRAGRVDEAYASTSEDFKSRIGRKRFDELTRRYADYRKAREKGVGASGAGVSSGLDSLTETEYAEVDKGRFVHVTMTIRRDRDSILMRTPPPVRVDDFDVVETADPEGKWRVIGPARRPGR